MRFRFFICLLILLFLTTGCVVTNMVKGEYYLTEEDYKAGIQAFRIELQKKPNDHRIHYYLGRYYLGENLPKESLKYLKKAAKLDPNKANYFFWLGVAYSANKQRTMEWKSYLKAKKLNPNHLKNRIYLAHTQLERKKYEIALKNYLYVLRKKPDEPACLYNRALITNMLKRTGEERKAWIDYLNHYPSGPMARYATDHLNKLGDFTYRNHLIGFRTITLKKIEFKPFSSVITKDSKSFLDLLGTVLTHAKKISIHIVVYQKNNKNLARKRAKSIKKYLLTKYPKIETRRLKVSWFGVSEKIKIKKKRFYEPESVNFVTAAK